MAIDGIVNTNRVETTSERKLNAIVVDNILNSATYSTRLMGMGRPMTGKTQDFTVKITDSGAGEFYTGLETLNTSASDTTITLSYAHTGFTQPFVSVMLEAFANSGPTGTINLQNFKLEEAVQEAKSRIGTAVYGSGSGNQPLGLEALIDDGSTASTIGGQSRSTYTALQGTVTDSGGTLSLAKLATLHDSISASSMENEEPTIHVTTKTIWSLYEQLINPQIRNDYASIGYNKLPLRSTGIVTPGDLRGASGFSALSYRGRPVIKDDKATSGVWYSPNENYLFWLGRNTVPTKWAPHISKVSLGKSRVLEGPQSEAMPRADGWFFQREHLLPHQAGTIGRYHVIGQFATNQPRRHGKLTGITGV